MDLPEIDLHVESEVIHAKTRKLKAVWTAEMVQDMKDWSVLPLPANPWALLDEYGIPEKEWGFKKKRLPCRSIDDEWDVSRQN